MAVETTQDKRSDRDVRDPMSGLGVGRTVHYVNRGTTDGRFPPVCRAAIVTTVNEDGTIGLCILNPHGVSFEPAVMGDQTQRQPNTWHWPEYVP